MNDELLGPLARWQLVDFFFYFALSVLLVDLSHSASCPPSLPRLGDYRTLLHHAQTQKQRPDAAKGKTGEETELVGCLTRPFYLVELVGCLPWF